jgi:hypothetical protein
MSSPHLVQATATALVRPKERLCSASTRSPLSAHRARPRRARHSRLVALHTQFRVDSADILKHRRSREQYGCATGDEQFGDSLDAIDVVYPLQVAQKQSKTADKQPNVSVLEERRSTAIRLGSLFIAATVAVAVFFLTRITDHGEKLATIQATLTQIQGEQRKAVPLTVGSLLEKPSASNLGMAAALLKTAKEKDRKSDPALLHQNAIRLEATPSELKDSPEFWQAASELISYRSQQVSTAASASITNCLDRSPTTQITQATNSGPAVFTHGPFVYSNCSIELDSPKAAEIFRNTLSLGDLELRHCRVVYRGGPIVVPGARGELKFVDCLFDISTPLQPANPGRELVANLLAAENLNYVTFNLGKS